MPRSIAITESETRTIVHALKCMEEHLQYEDEWSNDEKEDARKRYLDAQRAIERGRTLA